MAILPYARPRKDDPPMTALAPVPAVTQRGRWSRSRNGRCSPPYTARNPQVSPRPRPRPPSPIPLAERLVVVGFRQQFPRGTRPIRHPRLG